MLKSLVQKLILAIETSCDETSVAVWRGWQLLANEIYSQVDLHKQYGGVVPGIAKLAHQQKLPTVYEWALEAAGIQSTEVELIAVTQGPGLAIALEVGINFAQSLALELNVPVIGVNHMEGHLWSPLISILKQNIDQNDVDAKSAQTAVDDFLHSNFAFVSLLVSGGHTEFVQVNGVGEYKILGETLDDACGEAYDKVAYMLGLGYPGGPEVSKCAEQARAKFEISEARANATTFVQSELNGETFRMPIPLAASPEMKVSYSGLKTAAKQLIAQLSGVDKKLNPREMGEQSSLSEEQIQFVCLLFEEAALRMLVKKLETAIQRAEARSVWVGGGVVANARLREMVRDLSAKFGIEFYYPSDKNFWGDNAGMIGLVAELKIATEKLILENPQRNFSQDPSLAVLDRKPNWSIADV